MEDSYFVHLYQVSLRIMQYKDFGNTCVALALLILCT